MVRTDINAESVSGITHHQQGGGKDAAGAQDVADTTVHDDDNTDVVGDDEEMLAAEHFSEDEFIEHCRQYSNSGSGEDVPAKQKDGPSMG